MNRPVSLLSDFANVSLTLDDVAKPSDLAQLITTNKWSPARYVDGHRKKENARDVGWLVYDVDGGLPIEEAVRRLDASGLAYLVGASKTHRLPKDNQPAADRYRIAVPLGEPISDPATYEATWQTYADSLGLPADEAARDISRFWFPCREEPMYLRDEGEEAEVITPRRPELPAAKGEPILDREAYAASAIRSVRRRMAAAEDGDKHGVLVSCAGSLGRLVSMGADVDALRAILVECVDAWGARVKDRAHAMRTIDEQLGWGAANGHVWEPEPAATPAAPTTLRVYSMADLDGLRIEAPAPIAGAITRESLSFVFGAPNVRKTWFVLELARQAIANGQNVLLVAEEGHLHWLRWRFRAMGLMVPQLRLLYRNRFLLSDPKAVRAITDQGLDHGAGLIICDPLVNMMRCNENDVEAVAPVVDSLVQVFNETKAAVVAVHHSDKAAVGPESQPSLYNIRGSTVLPGAADFMYELRRFPKDKDRTEIHLVKHRDGAPGPDGYMETRFPGGDVAEVRWVSQEEAQAVKEEALRAEGLAEANRGLDCSLALEAAIKQFPRASGRRLSSVLTDRGFSARETKAALDALVARGLVDEVQEGTAYRYTWKGLPT